MTISAVRILNKTVKVAVSSGAELLDRIQEGDPPSQRSGDAFIDPIAASRFRLSQLSETASLLPMVTPRKTHPPFPPFKNSTLRQISSQGFHVLKLLHAPQSAVQAALAHSFNEKELVVFVSESL